jgi:hypothetical protein
MCTGVEEEEGTVQRRRQIRRWDETTETEMAGLSAPL